MRPRSMDLLRGLAAEPAIDVALERGIGGFATRLGALSGKPGHEKSSRSRRSAARRLDSRRVGDPVPQAE